MPEKWPQNIENTETPKNSVDLSNEKIDINEAIVEAQRLWDKIDGLWKYLKLNNWTELSFISLDWDGWWFNIGENKINFSKILWVTIKIGEERTKLDNKEQLEKALNEVKDFIKEYNKEQEEKETAKNQAKLNEIDKLF